MSTKPRQILKSLFDPEISEFINWEKVIKSTKFIQLAEDHIEHFHQYGDYTLIKRTLDHFHGHKFFKPMLRWCCDSAGLDFSFKGSGLVLKRAASARKTEGNLSDYLAKYNGTAKDVGGVVSSPPRKPTRQQELARLFNPDGHRGGSPCVQGGAPGLGRRR